MKIHPNDLDSNRGIGLKLPLTSDNNTFFALNMTTADQIKTNLRNLILTKKGERPMLPTYGCGLLSMLFENDNDIESNILEDLNTQVKRWIPYVNITNLDVKNNNDHTISIIIGYSTKFKDDTLTVII